MTIDEIRATLRDVQYKGWAFAANADEAFGYLQAHFDAPDGDTGVWVRQKGRKWMLSRHMTRSEVIQTAFLAVKTAEEHELREQFLYRGRAVFGPHIDTEALFEAAERHDARKEPDAA